MSNAIVYVPCGDCQRRGAYLVPNRPVLRCKYCRSLRHLSTEEQRRVDAKLQAVVLARRQHLVAAAPSSWSLVDALSAAV